MAKLQARIWKRKICQLSIARQSEISSILVRNATLANSVCDWLDRFGLAHSSASSLIVWGPFWRAAQQTCLDNPLKSQEFVCWRSFGSAYHANWSQMRRRRLAFANRVAAKS